jgi:hypothetical protein
MRYATCSDQHFDPVAGTCAQIVWIDQPSSLLPPMTTGEGLAVSVAIVGVLGVAFVIRVVIRVAWAARA